MEESSRRKTQPITLWRRQEFLKLWSGQTVSVFGSAVTSLALPLTAVLTLSATPAQMGLLSAMASLPFLLVSLFAGAWIDRSQRKPIMIAADFGRAILLCFVPLGMLFGFLSIELLFAVQLLVGVLTVFFDIAYMAYLPTMVGRSHLVEGNSKLEISASTAATAGPGLAGWIIEQLGAPFAIAIDAASFLVSGFTLSWISLAEPAPVPVVARKKIWLEIRDGIKVVTGNPILRSVAACSGMANLFSSLWGAIYILYLTRNLQIPPGLLGIIFATGAPGALLGALLSNWVVRKIGPGPTIIAASALSGLSGLLVLLAHGDMIWIALVLILSEVCLGITNVVYNVNQLSLRQSVTPNHLLGRMNASMRFLIWGALPLGGLMAGVLGSTIGVPATLAVGIIGKSCAFLWILISPVRKLKQQPALASD